MDSEGLPTLITHCKICSQGLQQNRKCRCVRRRTCRMCGFISASINASYQHHRSCRSKSMNAAIIGKNSSTATAIQCERCVFKCQYVAELNKHLRQCTKRCIVCDREFKSGSSTKRHEAGVHGVTLGHKFKSGVCNKCGEVFLDRTKLLQHITTCIIFEKQQKNPHLKSACESYFFKSEATFDQWLEKMQIETKTYFVKQSGTNQQYEHTTYKYLYCQHGREAQSEKERKTNRKRKIGLLPYYACPARMSVKIKNQATTVKFYSKHNHPLTDDNLKYQPFPVSMRKAVKRKISMGVSSRVILHDLRSESSVWKLPGNETNKVSLLSQNYIDKMRYALKLQSSAENFDDSHTSELSEDDEK